MGKKVLRKQRKPNYLGELIEKTKHLQPGTINHVAVYHNDDCSIFGTGKLTD